MRFILLAVALLLPQYVSATAQKISCPRIISQSPYITNMLEYLGMKQCIVGVSRYSQHNLPRTGGILDPDAEMIDSLMPDLFITSDWATQELVDKVTPEKSHSIRLSSFNRMEQLEQNMREIVKATGWQQAESKIEDFSNSWREKLKQVKGNNKEVLLLSSCSGTPYSFGPDSRLYDLFSRAGFRVVETGKRIRHIRPGNEIEDLTALLNIFKPDLLFVFEQKLKKQCQMLLPKKPVRVVSFDGALFLHPGVEILEGLDQLIDKRKFWQ